MRPFWRPVPFIVSHILAALLFASWLLPPTDAWWDRLDDAVFWLFNNSLALGEGWRLFWALANHRAVDLLSGTLAGAVAVWWLWGSPRNVQCGRVVALCCVAVPLVILPFIAHYAIENWIHYQRPSPTLVREGAQRLTELVPFIATKDASLYAFPGDHAFVLLSIVLFYGYLAERKFVTASALLAVIFVLPRLVAGAHWLTDDVIGGGVSALIVTAWVLATPAAYHLSTIFVPVVSRVIGFIPARFWIPEYPADGNRREP